MRSGSDLVCLHTSKRLTKRVRPAGDLLHVQALGNCGISHNGSHLLTTMTMFAGSRVRWVMGEAEVDPFAPDDDFQGTGYVGFANGARGSFRTFSNGPNEWSFDVTGTDGMIRVIEDGRAIEHWVLDDPPDGMRKKAPARRVLPPPLRQRSPGVNAVYDLIDCIDRTLMLVQEGARVSSDIVGMNRLIFQTRVREKQSELKDELKRAQLPVSD